MRNSKFIFRACSLGTLPVLILAGAGLARAQTPAPAVPRRLTLAEAENLLLQRNLAIATARYQLDASRATRLMAAYKPNPVVTLGGEQFILSGALPHDIVHTSTAAAQTTYTARVDKIIERGGKRELRTAQADFAVKATDAQIRDTIRAQLFQLRQAFNTAMVARENLRLAEATDHQYEQTEKLTLVKLEAGDVAGAELYRARSGRLQFQQAVLQAHTAYEQATRDVLNLLGARPEQVAPAAARAGGMGIPARSIKEAATDAMPQPVAAKAATGQEAYPTEAVLRGAVLEIAGDFTDAPVSQTIAELRAIALAERPDVAAAHNLAEAARQGFLLAQAQRTRDLDVASEYQRIGSDNTVGVTVSLPLFLYNDQRAGIALADAQRRAAEAQVRQAELQAITDVDKAYQSHLAARRTLDLYNTRNLGQVEKLLNIVLFSYKEGAVSLFETLDAQRTYNQAMTAYNQARADYQMSLWQLEQAIGRPLK